MEEIDPVKSPMPSASADANRRLTSNGVEKIIKESEAYAKKNGFRLNPDGGAVEGIVKGLREREEKMGFRYCPCRRATGDKEKDKSIICPCIYHKSEIEKLGRCLCGLFVKT